MQPVSLLFYWLPSLIYTDKKYAYLVNCSAIVHNHHIHQNYYLVEHEIIVYLLQ